ncbi:hypothetical protein VU01_10204 [Candidatus Electrothrix marina]|uniref:Uncharacterized protein n=1 Tax=Candidatus Electrothrix marina TaxID=1859130 RepID=A0A444JH72_9BACT|nr:hypothetical protein VT99_13682 [Candidatus Electrothrix marina]RWX52318.1 hypothetical protein VU01_10204 [Candidatus Electrothrix marina]
MYTVMNYTLKVRCFQVKRKGKKMFLMIPGGRNHNYVLSFLSCRGGTPVFTLSYRTDTGVCPYSPVPKTGDVLFEVMH